MAIDTKKLRQIHGKMHEWKIQQHRKAVIRHGYKLSKKSEKIDDEDYPVDFIVTWVDGSDPEWLAEKLKYTPDGEKNDTIDARFRDWDIFQYWFRAIEKYAPWVRNVYLVTYGHIPAWLNQNCSKLRIIKHSDFIPEKYLPTFSSHTIEANLWRIPDLSEHFIYLNDDVYLMRPLKKSDFFLHGLPKYSGIAKPMETFIGMNAHRYARFNSFGVINSYFDIAQCMEKNPDKWFNYKYDGYIKYNIRAYEDGYISGMYYTHVGVPFRKSTMIDFCNHFPEIVDRTCINKFRTSGDIMHQVVQMWEMFNGTFEPVEVGYYGKFYSPTVKDMKEITDEIANGECRMMCINDHEGIDDLDVINSMLKEAFSKKYPTKSAFEL